MKRISGILSALCLVIASACGQANTTPNLKTEEITRPLPSGAGLTIRYIANEGVLIASGGKQVLIDGLHREYRPAYLFPPPAMQSVLENARAPYDKIDFVLVSHVHLDHFHPQAVGEYLKSNSKAVLASSEQVIANIAENFAEYERIRSQIRPIRHELKKTVEMNQNGVRIRFLGLQHSGERWKDIQNLGHVIEIGGKKLLHIGDADMTRENFAAFDLAREKIDVAFIPYWFLISSEGRALVREQFDPKHIIAVHIPPNEADDVAAQLRKELPEAIPFTKILEERVF